MRGWRNWYTRQPWKLLGGQSVRVQIPSPALMLPDINIRFSNCTTTHSPIMAVRRGLSMGLKFKLYHYRNAYKEHDSAERQQKPRAQCEFRGKI